MFVQINYDCSDSLFYVFLEFYFKFSLFLISVTSFFFLNEKQFSKNLFLLYFLFKFN